MALSQKVAEELLEAKSHLRTALKNAATNEKVYVAKSIADILMSIENIEKAETLIDKLESRRPGDSGIFGQFFTDL